MLWKTLTFRQAKRTAISELYRNHCSKIKHLLVICKCFIPTKFSITTSYSCNIYTCISMQKSHPALWLYNYRLHCVKCHINHLLHKTKQDQFWRKLSDQKISTLDRDKTRNFWIVLKSLWGKWSNCSLWANASLLQSFQLPPDMQFKEFQWRKGLIKQQLQWRQLKHNN